MSERKRERLGQGVESLFSEPPEEKRTEEPEKVEVEGASNLYVDKLEVRSEKLEDAIKSAKKNPRTSTWSPRATAVLRYLRSTVPEFSMSNEASSLLEKAVRDKYPEIWRRVQDVSSSA